MKAAINTGWSPERRATQAEAIRRWKPWERSTGPRTAPGKETASRNAVKSGAYDRAAKRLAYVFSLQNQYRRLYNELNRTGQLALFPRLWRARLIHEQPSIRRHGLDTAHAVTGGIDTLIYRLFIALTLPEHKNPPNELLDAPRVTRHCEEATPTKQSSFPFLDCFATLAMTSESKIMQKTGFFGSFALHHPP